MEVIEKSPNTKILFTNENNTRTENFIAMAEAVLSSESKSKIKK